MANAGGTYAGSTTVGVEKSRGEIERTLKRYGAHAFAYGYEDERAMVGFKMNDRSIRLLIRLPQPIDFAKSPTGIRRTDKQMRTHFEQAVRQRWRALLLIVKAKLEAVEAGIAEFDEEWLAYLVLPDGHTVAEKLDVQAAMEGRQLPALLPGSQGELGT